MMIDPSFLFFAAPADPTGTGHPYRTAPAPRPVEPDSARVPYDGQTRMRLTISSGLAHARVVIDPAARDLVAIESGDGRQPRIRLAASELALTWRVSFGDWVRDVLTAGHDDLAIVLHPAVAWTIAIRGGLSHLECDLSAGTVARIDVAGGCSHVRFDLPLPTSVVPIRIAGGASRVSLRRPAEAGVTVGVDGGISMLRLDDRGFDAIGGAARLDSGNVVDGTPRYELSISGGASDLAIERR
jgi:hypothetical protein